MSNYVFVMRFDDNTNSLTSESGLSIEELGELLISLSKAIGLKKEEPLTLSKVRNNCYAFELTTNKFPVYENLKNVHDRISNKDFDSLNSDQMRYATKLNVLLGDRYRMNVYDPNKTFDFKIKIEKENLVKKVEFYYEIDDIYGIVTSIGGKSIESKPCIKIPGINYDIFITPAQESKLIKYFKKDRLRFKFKRKINFETDRTVSADLIEFEIVNKPLNKLVDNVEQLISKQNKRPLFNKVTDSVVSVRKLRGNINLLEDEREKENI